MRLRSVVALLFLSAVAVPAHAQDIYREAFNHAYGAHAGEIDREQRSHMIAWAAVKRNYMKADDREWVPRHP